MDSYSRFQSEFHNATRRVESFRQEAATKRLVDGQSDTARWRNRLAAQLHGLADRIGSTSDSAVKGILS